MADNDVVFNILLRSEESLNEIKTFSQKASKEVEKVTKSVDETNETIKKTSKSVGILNLSFASMLGNLQAKAITKIFSTISSTISQTTDDFLEFSKSVSFVNSILPKTESVTDDVRKQFIALSASFGGTAADQARAYYEIISAGINDTAVAMDLLLVANKASVAGLTDIKTAIDGVTSVVAAYSQHGLSAARASDIMFASAAVGKTQFADLAQNLGVVTPIAAAAGVKFDELAGVIGYVTKIVPGTDQAVVGLRQAISSIISPTEQAKQAAKDLRIEFNANALKSKGLVGVFEDVKRATNGNIDKINALFGNIRALTVVSAIASGNFEDFRRIVDETRNSVDATSIAFKRIEQSASFQFDTLMRELRELPLLFLNASDPAFAEMFRSIREFVKASIPILAQATQALANFGAGVATVMFALSDATGALYDWGGAILSFVAGTDDGTKLVGKMKDAITGNKNATSEADQKTQDFRNSTIELFSSLQNAAKEIEKNSESIFKVDQTSKSAAGSILGVKGSLDELNLSASALNPKLVDFAAGIGSTEALLMKLEEQRAVLIEARDMGLVDQQLYEQQETLMFAEARNKRVELNRKYIQTVLQDANNHRKMDLQQEVKYLENMKKENTDNAAYQIALETELNKKRADLRKQELHDRDVFLSTTAMMANSNNKTLAMIGKAAAITQIAIKTPEAVASSFAFGARIGGPPLGFIFGAIAATAMADQAARVAGVALATGMTNVPAGYPNDTFPARLTSGERVVTTEQNKDLTSFLNDQRDIDNQDIVDGLDVINENIQKLNTSIMQINFSPTIEIDGREVVRVINDQVRSGRRIA